MLIQQSYSDRLNYLFDIHIDGVSEVSSTLMSAIKVKVVSKN